MAGKTAWSADSPCSKPLTYSPRARDPHLLSSRTAPPDPSASQLGET